MRKRYMVAAPHVHADMTFEAAAAAFMKAMDFNPQQKEDKLRRHVGFVEPGTIEDYGCSFRALGKFFTGMRLNNISPAHIRTYQEQRVSGQLTDQEHRPANMKGSQLNPNTVNKELGLLLRILKMSKAWNTEMMESYTPLSPQESDTQRAMTPKEQEHFLRIAASKPEWSTVYWYSILALRTTMSTLEIRTLRFRDIDVFQAIVKVGSDGAKNKYRIRTIPIDNEGIRAANFLMERARGMGARLPEHFLFPFRVIRNEFDPQRPMTESGIRGFWEDVRAAADLPWLRPYDLRHTAITRLAEAGTPIQVIMDMAGHVSQKMQMHYTHISVQSKRSAVDMSALTQASAIKKGASVRTMAFAAAGKIDNAVGAGVASVGNLIKKLQRAGLAPDVILGILADEGE